MNPMKQLETHEVEIGENKFYIRPFPAFRAANLSGELAALMLPLLSSLTPLLKTGESEGNIFDVDVNAASPAIASAFSSLSGDKVEMILKHLLINGKNVAVEMPGEKVKTLTEDLVNEIFCTEVQDMFVLAWHVIRISYNGFFNRLRDLFGPAGEAMTAILKSKNTGTST